MSNAKRLTKRDDEHMSGSLAWEITEPVNMAQLDAEIVAEMNWRKPAGLLTEGLTEDATTEDPVVVWVTHENGKVSTISSVLNDHTPDANWRPEGDPEVDKMSARDLLARIDSGDLLDAAEITAALRILLAPLAEADTETPETE